MYMNKKVIYPLEIFAGLDICTQFDKRSFLFYFSVYNVSYKSQLFVIGGEKQTEIFPFLLK